MIPFVVLAIIFAVVLHFTPFGRSLYAIGLNKEAAQFSGIDVGRTKFILFVLSAARCRASPASTSRCSTRNARGDNAIGMELQIIAAVLLGGVSIFGGRGAIHGVIAGVLLIGTLGSALRLAGITSDIINVITGVLLISRWFRPASSPGCTSRRATAIGKRRGGRALNAPRARDLHPYHPPASPSHQGKETMMFGIQRKRRAGLAAALAVGSRSSSPAVPVAARAGDAVTAVDDGDANLSITMLPKNLGNAYFDTSTGGAEEATEEFGGTFEEVGPSEASPTSQVQYIQTAAQQGAGGLIVSANDPEALCDALDEARDAGVKVVTFDSDTNPDCRDLFINQATAEGIAKVQVDLIAEQIGDEGQIAILSASANATNQNAWIETDGRASSPSNHPNIELVEVVYGDDDDQTSFDKTAALLQTYPDLKGIISPTTVGIAAAARYLSTSEYKGKVALTGLGTPNQMREYVEDGTVTAFALWNPADLGYLAAFAAQALITGEITGEDGDSFEAGKLGTFEVGADATVLLGEPVRVRRRQHRRLRLLSRRPESPAEPASAGLSLCAFIEGMQLADQPTVRSALCELLLKVRSRPANAPVSPVTPQ